MSHSNQISPNLIVASTNLAAIPAILLELEHQNYIHVLVLLFAALSSTWYHLIENKKHDMPGYFPEYRDWTSHWYFLNIDRLGALSAVFLYMPRLRIYTEKNGWGLFWWGVCALLMMGISESCEYVRKDLLLSHFQTKRRGLREGLREFYMLTHCLWHVMAFLTALELAR